MMFFMKQAILTLFALYSAQIYDGSQTGWTVVVAVDTPWVNAMTNELSTFDYVPLSSTSRKSEVS